MRAIVTAILALVVMSVSAIAQQSDKHAAPFGLTWGMSAADAKALGAELTEDKQRAFGVTFMAANLPKVLSDVAAVVLSFGYDDKLWRIAAVSKTFSNDPSGSAVVHRYDELSKLLAEKYGPGKANHMRGEVLSKQSDFILAVKSGYTQWYMNFDGPAVFVQLGIGAEGMSDGYWRMIFENKLLRSNFEKGKKTHEKNAL